MKQLKYILFCAILIQGLSCKKEDEFLDKKPDKGLVVPTTLEDFSYLLDNNYVFTTNASPFLGSLAVENYYVEYSKWLSTTSATSRNAYVWSKDIYNGEYVADWFNMYSQVYYCNVIFDGMAKVTANEITKNEYNRIKGSALFYRSLAFFDLAQIFANPYDSAKASVDLGIPLHQSSYISDKVKRSNIKDTYDRIINDLLQADSLLPDLPAHKTRPSKYAAKALLSRIYLSTGNYTQALKFSDQVLQFNSSLIDFNTLSTTSSSPITKYREQDIYYREQILNSFFYSFSAKIDSVFYKTYNDNDLRKVVFFSKTTTQTTFKGSYAGASYLYYTGLATDEMYFIRAESNARLGNLSIAMRDINNLLRNRYKKVGNVSTYTDQSATNMVDALKIIFAEKKKELIYRGTRWQDLRRLNKDTRFVETLTRTLNGTVYTLTPNDLTRYVYPIPSDEIQLNPMPQNPRE